MKIVVSLLAVAVISGCSFQLGRSAEEQERDDKIIEMYLRGGEIARQAEIKKAREERKRQEIEKSAQTCTWPAWLCGP